MHKVRIIVFSDMMLFCLADTTSWRTLSTRLGGITSHRTIILKFTNLRTSNFPKFLNSQNTTLLNKPEDMLTTDLDVNELGPHVSNCPHLEAVGDSANHQNLLRKLCPALPEVVSVHTFHFHSCIPVLALLLLHTSHLKTTKNLHICCSILVTLSIWTTPSLLICNILQKKLQIPVFKSLCLKNSIPQRSLPA